MLIAAQNLQQFRLPVAGDPGNPQDLATANLETDALQPLDTILVGDAQVLDLKHLAIGRGRRLAHAQKYLAADHHLGQLFRIGVFRLDRGGHLAPPHHADGIRHFHDLAQFVGDQDDGFALIPEPAQDAEQVVGLGGCQNAGGLVQDQDVRMAVERLQDFDPLLHADADLLDRGVGIDVQLVFLGQFRQKRARLFQRGHEPCAFLGAKHDVFQNREVLDQLEMLEHHPDAGGDGGLAVGDLGFFAVDEDLARVGLVEPVEDRHQGRFARAVFADDPVDRSRHDADRNILVRLNRPEGLGDSAKLNGRGGRCRPPLGSRPVAHQNSSAGQLSLV